MFETQGLELMGLDPKGTAGSPSSGGQMERFINELLRVFLGLFAATLIQLVNDRPFSSKGGLVKERPSHRVGHSHHG